MALSVVDRGWQLAGGRISNRATSTSVVRASTSRPCDTYYFCCGTSVFFFIHLQVSCTCCRRAAIFIQSCRHIQLIQCHADVYPGSAARWLVPVAVCVVNLNGGGASTPHIMQQQCSINNGMLQQQAVHPRDGKQIRIDSREIWTGVMTLMVRSGVGAVYPGGLCMSILCRLPSGTRCLLFAGAGKMFVSNFTDTLTVHIQQSMYAYRESRPPTPLLRLLLLPHELIAKNLVRSHKTGSNNSGVEEHREGYLKEK